MRVSSFILYACIGLTMLFLTQPALPDSEDLPKNQHAIENAEKLYAEAGVLADNGQHALALGKYESCLELFPENPNILYNAGLSAQLSDQHEKAITYFTRLLDRYPDDFGSCSRLIQIYEHLGDKEKRKQYIDMIYRMKESGEVEAMANVSFFCRDQFQVGKQKVMVFDYFKLEGERAVKYVFIMLDDTGQEEKWRISLGSYDRTNSFMQETGEIGPDDRAYHLDGYFPNGHATYGFYKNQPAYDNVKKTVIGILEEKIQAASTSVHNPENVETESDKEQGK